MTSLQIYCGLFLATALYAFVLSRFPQLEPDLTFLEVIVGVAICLYAAYLDRTYNSPMTAEIYEERVWLAFKVGGAPIVLWQISKSIRAWSRLFRHLLSRFYGNTSDRATSVASQRRGKPPEGD